MAVTPSPAPRQGALAFYAVTLMSFLAAAAAPTPLYRLYQEFWALSPVMVTLVFGIYAISLLLALLVVGSISDRHGRRPAIVAALALQVVAMALFVLAPSVEWLLAARTVQGFATGIAVSSLASAMVDCEARAGQLLNSVAPLVGMAAGALVAGALAAHAPAPLTLVYALLLVVFAVEIAVTLRLPEPNRALSAVPHSFRPRVSVPLPARRAMLAIAPLNIATWTFGGFALSLLPSVVATATGITTPLLGAGVVALLNLSGAVAVYAFRARTAGSVAGAGAATMALGVALLVGGIAAGSVPAILLSAVPAGAGFGASFLGSVRTIVPLVGPSERARLMSAFFVMSYLSFSVPAIAAGFLVRSIGTVATAEVYGAVVLTLIALGVGTLATLKPHAAPLAA